jgi:hypothetical protein
MENSMYLSKLNRYRPEIVWSNGSWVHNLFRLFELIFGRKYGIRKESATSIATGKNGQLIIHREFYTWEALFAHCESVVREFVKLNSFSFEWVEIPKFQLVGGGAMDNPSFPLVRFAIARDASAKAFDNTGFASSVTFNQTCTGSNLTLFLLDHHANPGTRPRATPTYNGTSFTDITSAETNSGGGFAPKMWLAGLIAPTTGTHSVVVGCSSLTDTFNANVISYTGTNQNALSSVFNSYTDTTGSNHSGTVSITISRDNSAALAAFVVQTDGSPGTSYTTAAGSIIDLNPNSTAQPTAFFVEDSPLSLSSGTGVSLGWSKTPTSGIASGGCITQIEIDANSFTPTLTEGLSSIDTIIKSILRTVSEGLRGTDVVTAGILKAIALLEGLANTDIIRSLKNGTSVAWTHISKSTDAVWSKISKSTTTWSKASKSTTSWNKTNKSSDPSWSKGSKSNTNWTHLDRN